MKNEWNEDYIQASWWDSDFVNTVSKYEFDMDMKKGHVVVDAKSLLGIMHLGINNEIALQMYTDDCEELCREIAKYAA